MRPEWWFADLGLFALFILGVWFQKIRRLAVPTLLSVLLLAILEAQLILFATASTLVKLPEVDLRHAKPMVLAIAGGLLSQIVILLDQAMRGALPKAAHGRIYSRGLMGLYSGLVGLLLVAALYQRVDNIEDVSDQLAALSGVAAGGIGVGVVTVASTLLTGMLPRERQQNRLENAANDAAKSVPETPDRS